MYKCFLKRILDLIFSLLVFVVLMPVFILIVIVLFFYNSGKPFFLQARPGKNDKIFKVIKFKTMNDKKDKNGELLSDAKRLTSIGRFIRKTSLDEIPQLLNVIRGDMSLVGPRPLLVSYLPYYTERERKRHQVRPGITGLAQISGRNYLMWDERLELDVKYVETVTLKLDIAIFFKTVIKVLKRDDVAVIPSELGQKLNEFRK